MPYKNEKGSPELEVEILRQRAIQAHINAAIAQRQLILPACTPNMAQEYEQLTRQARDAVKIRGHSILNDGLTSIIIHRYAVELSHLICAPLVTNETLRNIVFRVCPWIEKPTDPKRLKEVADVLEIRFGIANRVEGLEFTREGIFVLYEPIIDGAIIGLNNFNASGGKFDPTAPIVLPPWPRETE